MNRHEQYDVNILLPIAGKAQRFIDKGFTTPKPLLPIDGEPMIKRALASLITDSTIKCRLIFIVREEHCVNHDIINTLKYLFSEYDTDFIIENTPPQGTLSSCLKAYELVDDDTPLVIYTPDVEFVSDFDIKRDFVDTHLDGMLLTFKANSPDHSYVLTDHNGYVIETAEKIVISSDAIVGVYGYRSGKLFVKHAKHMIDLNLRVKNEFYVAPMYNLLIEDGLKIGTFKVDKMYVLGTPDDVAFYEKYVLNSSVVNQIAVCCDHSGFTVKERLRSIIDMHNIKCIDFGSYTITDSDHYDSLKPCIQFVKSNRNTVGIGICHTGQGFNIPANKVAGIRSVLISDSYSAMMGKRHNAANFFSISARDVQNQIHGYQILERIVSEILKHTFDGGRHATRIQRIMHDDLFIE